MAAQLLPGGTMKLFGSRRGTYDEMVDQFQRDLADIQSRREQPRAEIPRDTPPTRGCLLGPFG